MTCKLQTVPHDPSKLFCSIIGPKFKVVRYGRDGLNNDSTNVRNEHFFKTFTFQSQFQIFPLQDIGHCILFQEMKSPESSGAVRPCVWGFSQIRSSSPQFRLFKIVQPDSGIRFMIGRRVVYKRPARIIIKSFQVFSSHSKSFLFFVFLNTIDSISIRVSLCSKIT